MRKLLALAILGLSTLGIVSVSAPAQAAVEDCKTVVTDVTNRPDNGDHGAWAIDTFEREVTICRVPDAEVAAKASVPVEAWNYSAKFKDNGTFVTQGGAALSPQAGAELKAGVHGKFSGTQSMTFTAPANWLGFSPKESVSGATPSTQDWIKVWWPDGSYTNHVAGDAWKYTYETCNEKWVESNAGNTGDITGMKPCPSASPSASASPTVTASSSHAAGVPPAASDSLPLTGAPVGALVAGGIGLVGLGALAVLLGRRRRIRPIS